MSDANFEHDGTSGPMPQQPKFKDCVWDSAKDSYTVESASTFRTWLCIFGGIVTNVNTAAEPQLERFLDLLLNRDPQAATTRSPFVVSGRSEAVSWR